MKNLLSILFFFSSITAVKAQYAHDPLKTEDGYLHNCTKGEGSPFGI